MPKRTLRVQRRRSRKTARKTRQVELPISRVSYQGPVRWPAEATGHDLHTVVTHDDGTLTTDASGNFNSVFTSNPNAPGGGFGAVSGWSSFAGVFDEYRVLAFEVQYVPFDRYNRGTTVYTTPIVGVLDYDNSTALTSFSQADAYGSARVHSLDVPFTITIHMSGIENSLFTNSAAPVALFWIKFFSTGNTASTAYGKLFARFRIQFRAKGQ